MLSPMPGGSWLFPPAWAFPPAAQTLANPLPAVVLTGDELDVRSGEWLPHTAAGSTVGHSVIQLGAHVGFKTLNVVRRRSAVEDVSAPNPRPARPRDQRIMSPRQASRRPRETVS